MGDTKKIFMRSACDQCDYKATTVGTLKRHKGYKHEGVCYSCNQCEYKATTTGNLKKHIDSIHEDSCYSVANVIILQVLQVV